MNIIDYTDYTIELEDSDRGCKIISYKVNKEGREIKITERKNKSGYKRWLVQLLNVEGNNKILVVARLILQHFKPDEWDEKLQADHIDFNSLNNRLKNLRMLTQKENKQKKSSKPNKNNKSSGHRYISYQQAQKLWVFHKTLNRISYYKYFKLLDEAVEFKEMFLIIHNCS